MSTSETNRADNDPPDGGEIFWGEMAPCEHLVQIYENDDLFLDALEGFAADGLREGDAVIVLATPAHLKGLEERLAARGVDVGIARSRNQFVSLDAEEALSQFMVEEWPDDDRFRQFVTRLVADSRGEGRRVRVFGELVAILWANGHNGATVRLEHLWHQFCRSEMFSLFCAYPRIGFTQDASESIREICAAHARVIGGNGFLELPNANAA